MSAVALFEELGDASFLNQTFLASSFYDIFPMVQSSLACADVLGMPFLAFTEFRTRLQAREDFVGIYGILLQLASAKAIALRLPRFTMQYFDFGEVESRECSADVVEGLRTGVPAILVPWYEAVVRSYCEEALVLSGNPKARVECVGRALGPVVDGLETTDLTLRLRLRGV